jgi:hypothetical protein
MTMSQAVHERSRWATHPASPETAGALVNAAAAAEIAVRAAAGILGVRVITGLVRDHPLLSILLASGIGYMFANGWRVGRGQAAGANPGRKHLTRG